MRNHNCAYAKYHENVNGDIAHCCKCKRKKGDARSAKLKLATKGEMVKSGTHGNHCAIELVESSCKVDDHSNAVADCVDELALNNLSWTWLASKEKLEKLHLDKQLKKCKQIINLNKKNSLQWKKSLGSIWIEDQFRSK